MTHPNSSTHDPVTSRLDPRWWRHLELLEHDRRGHQLSLDLQSALGPQYRIEYHFETSELRREMRQSR